MNEMDQRQQERLRETRDRLQREREDRAAERERRRTFNRTGADPMAQLRQEFAVSQQKVLQLENELKVAQAEIGLLKNPPGPLPRLVLDAQKLNLQLNQPDFKPTIKRPDAVTNTRLSGPFCQVYQSGDPAHYYLRGGSVSGGTGNEIVADIDLGPVATPPANGNREWLEVDFTATVEDGVLFPGGDVTGVTVGAGGTTLPANVVPTAADSDGMRVVDLGVWSDGRFLPVACGNIQVWHCPGSLTVSRDV